MNNPFAKQADKPYAPGIAPEQAAYNNQLKLDALKKIIKVSLLGLGAGAGSAAIFGMKHYKNPLDMPRNPAETEIDLPYPQVHKRADITLPTAHMWPYLDSYATSKQEGENAKDPTEGKLYGAAKGMLHGMSAMPGAMTGQSLAKKLFKNIVPKSVELKESPTWRQALRREGPPGPSMIEGAHASGVEALRLAPQMLMGTLGAIASTKLLNPFVRKLTHKTMGPPPEPKSKKEAGLGTMALKAMHLATPEDEQTPTLFSRSWLRGDSQTQQNAIPWRTPALVAGFGGSLVGGHALVRHLLHQKKKKDLEQQLATAQQEYESALMGEYDPAKLRHLNPKEASLKTTLLDHCYDLLEKNSFDFNSLAGQGTGMYLTGAGLLGAGGAAGMYKWMEGRSKHKALKEALKRRAFLRALQNPPELYVRPEGIDVSDPDVKDHVTKST